MFKKNKLMLGIMALGLAMLAVLFFLAKSTNRLEFFQGGNKNNTAVTENENTLENALEGFREDEQVPTSVPVSLKEVQATASDQNALGGYNVLIADRGNNRLLEVTPDKQIVWEYQFNLPKMGLGADDSFFTDNGRTVITNLEEYHIIQEIDYRTKQVIWSYGVGGHPGSAQGYLNTPDDAYKLRSGDITVTDIKNCRVLEISPDKKIVRQYGQTQHCGNAPGLLNSPNGDTPLPNGHTFISSIRGHSLIELDENWQPVFSMTLPVKYPSDPQLTKAGNILVSDYSNPGHIVEVAKNGHIVWSTKIALDRPSLAVELPNDNILAVDDYHHRIIVIDKKTDRVVWQYGVTGKPGKMPGQLDVPDGVDIIKR